MKLILAPAVCLSFNPQHACHLVLLYMHRCMHTLPGSLVMQPGSGSMLNHT